HHRFCDVLTGQQRVMYLVRLVAREVQISPYELLFLSALSGVTNALIIAMVNIGAEAASQGVVSLWAAATYIFSLLTYIWSMRILLATTSKEVENAIHRLRLRLMDDVRHSELISLETLGRSEIFAVITKDTAILTQAAVVIVVTAQAAVLVLFVSLYVAYLSL